MTIRERQNRIKAIEQMFRAARASVAHYRRACQNDPGLLGTAGFRIRDIRDCHEELEATFLLRVFAEFEGALQDFWRSGMGRQTSPATRTLLDRIAARCHVPWTELDRAHQVRAYRNAIIHEGEAPRATEIALPEARRHLCLFLSRLPANQ